MDAKEDAADGGYMDDDAAPVGQGLIHHPAAVWPAGRRHGQKLETK